MQERKVHTLPGSVALLISLGLLAAAVALPIVRLTPDITKHSDQHTGMIAGTVIAAIVIGLAGLVMLAGMFTVGPNDAVAEQLKLEIHDRCKNAGVEVLEARIAHLAYAQEIAQAMLQRQQAGAIIAARQRIVEGAVGMVEMALNLLSKKQIVELDADRKAAMVSNLLVVLCGERSTQPVINAGTLHQG